MKPNQSTKEANGKQKVIAIKSYQGRGAIKIIVDNQRQ